MADSLPSRPFISAHASAPTWREAVAQCVARLGGIPPTGLGFVYATDHFANDLSAIRDLLRAQTGIEHWVGTVGMGICADAREYFDQPALAVMIGAFDARDFRLLPILPTAAHAAKTDLTMPAGAANFAVVHADPGSKALDATLTALAKRLSSGFMVGGLTSSRRHMPQLTSDVVSGGLSGVVFSDDVVVATRLTQGCAPIGPRRTITRSYRNVLITIDDRPALDVLREDTAQGFDVPLEDASPQVLVGLPVRGADVDDYVVRHLVGIDPKQKFVAVSEEIQAGDSVFFCTRDRASASDDLERMLRSIKSGLYGAPRGALYFSCLGRGPNLFAEDSEELRIIRDHLGEIPLVGFFGNGEISHDRLYGYTGVLTLFL